MRSMTLALAALLLAALAPANAAGASDWRTEACTEAADQDSPVAGAQTVVSSQVTRVSELQGVRVTSERLDFSGVTCELLHVSGDLPAGAEVTGSGYSYATYVDLVVDGVDQGETQRDMFSGGSTQLYSSAGPELPGMPDSSVLFAAVTYRPVETGVFPVSPAIPDEWEGKSYTATYVRSEWTATFDGKALIAEPFDRTDATDRVARTSSTRKIARANASYDARVAEIKSSGFSASWKKDELAEAALTRATTVTVARKTLRLALRGKRLVGQRFEQTYTGTLLP